MRLSLLPERAHTRARKKKGFIVTFKKFKVTNFAHGSFLGRGEAQRALRKGKLSPRLKEQSHLNPVRKFLSADPPCISYSSVVAYNF